MEWDRTGLGDRAIESLRRIHLLILESIVYYSIGGDGGLTGEPWGLVMYVLDVSIACLTCTTDTSGVMRLAVRSNGSE